LTRANVRVLRFRENETRQKASWPVLKRNVRLSGRPMRFSASETGRSGCDLRTLSTRFDAEVPNWIRSLRVPTSVAREDPLRHNPFSRYREPGLEKLVGSDRQRLAYLSFLELRGDRGEGERADDAGCPDVPRVRIWFLDPVL